MPKDTSQQPEKLSFEESINTLDDLVNKLESGDLSLEESLEAFEKGINLTKQCQQHLSNAQQKVSMLVGEEDNLQLVDFDTNENN